MKRMILNLLAASTLIVLAACSGGGGGGGSATGSGCIWDRSNWNQCNWQ